MFDWVGLCVDANYHTMMISVLTSEGELIIMGCNDVVAVNFDDLVHVATLGIPDLSTWVVLPNDCTSE